MIYCFELIILDAVVYSSSFMNLPNLPIIPYTFQCSKNVKSLLNCTKYVLSCESLKWQHIPYLFEGIACQGIELFFCFKI